MAKTITILGSTGSIGVQALEVARLRGFDVLALTAHSNTRIIKEQILEFKPKYVAMSDPAAALELKAAISGSGTEVLCGTEGICECAAQKADTVLNGIVGMAGLEPTLSAIEAGNEVALANKETLVAAGALVMKRAAEKKVKILPVDSEHSAIFQVLEGCNSYKEIKRLILTASGGPFFGKTKEELRNVTLEQALNHPNWSMGAKITVDSATMINKGLELIEAVWLFNVRPEQVDILVHRQSIVHSMVEYVDNSVLAQLGVPDMRLPIQYALTYPERTECPAPELDLSLGEALTFVKPDEDTFRGIALCREAISKGGLYPAIANSANEAANLLFREKKIGFLQIAEFAEKALGKIPSKQSYNLEDVLETDRVTRRFVSELTR